MRILFATHNPHKLVQAQSFLKNDKKIIWVYGLPEAGITEVPDETAHTLIDNAHIKAVHAFKKRPPEMESYHVIADDSGLFIDALNDRPGVHSARWAGPNASAKEIVAHTLAQMKDVVNRGQNRGATFKTAIRLMHPTGTLWKFSGLQRGRILTEYRGEPLPGMPYSGLFVPEGDTRCLAEIPPDELLTASHRGKAFTALLEHLVTL